MFEDEYSDSDNTHSFQEDPMPETNADDAWLSDMCLELRARIDEWSHAQGIPILEELRDYETLADFIRSGYQSRISTEDSDMYQVWVAHYYDWLVTLKEYRIPEFQEEWLNQSHYLSRKRRSRGTFFLSDAPFETFCKFVFNYSSRALYST